jgi:pyruvate dehydrogenase E1 component beta subunit
MNGASHIALALSEAMDASDSVHLLGEALPLSAAGSALLSKYPSRCHLLPAADATLVGVAIGLAIAGKTPVVELSGADALWGAIQQIGQEGARLTGEFNATVVIRVPVNDHPEQLVRLLDGVSVSVASPADAADAGALVTAALRHNGVTVLLEPISVLHASGGQASEVSLGKARTLEAGTHITLAAWGSGVEATSAAARILGREGISAEVIDLRSLAPLDTEALAASVNKTGRLLLVGTGPHLLNAALDAAFLRLESPPAVVAPRTELITSKARAAVHY